MSSSWRFIQTSLSRAPVHVEEHPDNPLLVSPLAPLLMPNSGNSSNARDNAAIERTFLSWLRLAMYMAIVSIAILMNFHLKHQASPTEQKLSFPLGIVFWILSMACLMSGCINYFSLISKFARRQPKAQTGWKTQVVFTIVATTIVATCILFLALNVEQKS